MPIPVVWAAVKTSLKPTKRPRADPVSIFGGIVVANGEIDENS